MTSVLRDVISEGWLGGWLSKYGVAGQVFAEQVGGLRLDELWAPNSLKKDRPTNVGLKPLDLIFVAGEFSDWYAKIDWRRPALKGLLDIPDHDTVQQYKFKKEAFKAVKADWYSGQPHLVLTRKHVALRPGDEEGDGDAAAFYTSEMSSIRVGGRSLQGPGMVVGVRKLMNWRATRTTMMHEFVHYAQDTKGLGYGFDGYDKPWGARFHEVEASLGEAFMDELEKLARAARGQITVEAAARYMGYVDDPQKFFENVMRQVNRYHPELVSQYSGTHRNMIYKLHDQIKAMLKGEGGPTGLSNQ